ETWRMQNPDQFRLRNRAAGRVQLRIRIADFEVLIALRQCIEVKSVGRIGKENLRPHFRIDRLRVHIGEGNAEDERTQIIDIRDAAEVPKRALGKKMRVFSALVLPIRWTAYTAIHYPYIVEKHERAVARTSAEFCTLKPTAFGIVFGAQRGVGAAIEDPECRFAGDHSLGRRVAETREQQPGVALLF